MKNLIKIYLLFLSLSCSLSSFSQTSKSIYVPTPGKLSELMTVEEHQKVVNFTISGLIDRRDISYIASMSSLEILDMLDADIMAFTGLSSSPAYTIPSHAFSGTNIKKIYLPKTCVTIGKGAFSLCSKLEHVNFLLHPILATIEESAFLNCVSLPAIDMRMSAITSIGDLAFANCTRMTSLELGHLLFSIGNTSFSGCTSLYEVRLPAALRYLGEGAFEDCTSLEKVTSIETISDLDKIGNRAFKRCKSLSILKLPPSIKYIGDQAFQDCESLNDVTFGKNVQVIGFSAFQNCINLKVVEYEDPKLAELKVIGGYAFSGCEKLKSFIYTNISNTKAAKSITIGERAFNKCEALDEFVFANTIQTIGQYAFNGCQSLKGNLTLPLSLEKVEEGTFHSCTALTSLTIPTNIKNINRNAFYWCPGLTSIKTLNPIPIDLSSSSMVFYGVPRNTCSLLVPAGSESLYKKSAVWQEFLNLEGIGITTGIENDTFANDIKIYESATNNGFHIQNLDGVANIKLYDLMGKIRVSQRVDNDSFISTERLSKGYYILTVDLQGKLKTFRIAKK